MSNPLILVTGGTGPLGRPLARSLLEGGARVRVLTRRVPAKPEEGVEYVVADYIAGTGLTRALAGVRPPLNTLLVIVGRLMASESALPRFGSL